MDALFAQFPVNVIERSSAGLYTQAGDVALENARQDKEIWRLIVEKEIEFTKLQGTLDCTSMSSIKIKKKK